MIGIDTNIVIRFLTNDDAAQSPITKRLIQEETIWLPKTVILDAFWVLRTSYGLSKIEARQALKRFISIETIILEDASAVTKAFEMAEDGIEFADALHLASSPNADWFATFDEPFAKTANGIGGVSVRLP